MNQSHQYEQHPLLPSGEWEGFYLYPNESEKHKMSLELTFQKGKINGGGSDDVGAYSFKGTYDLEEMKCYLDKKYSTHRINYEGHIDENGIWGKWSSIYDESMGISKDTFDFLMMLAGDTVSGGFHIWPKKQKAKAKAKQQEKVKTKQLEEVV